MAVKERAEISSAAHAVRTAFSSGISSTSAAAFLEALDNGLDWEPATGTTGGAPGGKGPAERPLGFEQRRQVIRSRPDVLLGGLAYTGATNGPENLERMFGLVDPDGVPADGALAALSGAYLADGGLVADTRGGQ